MLSYLSCTQFNGEFHQRSSSTTFKNNFLFYCIFHIAHKINMKDMLYYAYMQLCCSLYYLTETTKIFSYIYIQNKKKRYLTKQFSSEFCENVSD